MEYKFQASITKIQIGNKQVRTRGVTCVWSCFLASTAASPISRVRQVVMEANHVTRLVGETAAMGGSRGSLPDFVLPEVKKEVVHL